MQTIAKFLKISKEQFINDFKNTLDNYDESQIENIYETIKPIIYVGSNDVGILRRNQRRRTERNAYRKIGYKD